MNSIPQHEPTANRQQAALGAPVGSPHHLGENDEPAVGVLGIPVPPVAPTEFCSSLPALFQINQSQSLAVVENGVVLGMLYRRKVTDQLSMQFGYALYQRRSVRDLMETHYLSVDATAPLSDVVRRALARLQETIYEDVVVVTDGKYLSLLSIQQMLMEQSARVARHMGLLAEHNAMLEATNRKLAAAMEDLRQTEAQLIQVEKISGIGTLAAGVAHDFNNMLNVILSSVGILQSKLPADSLLHRYCKFIEESTSRAADLTKQLLAFSQKNISTFTSLNVGEVINDTVRLLSRSVNKAIDIIVRTEENIPNIRADRTQIQQVLMNLILNGRDAMNGKGSLTISTSVKELDDLYCAMHPDTVPGRYVCIRVEDTGCGIPRHILPRIFDPFFTTKDVGKGTGLGLAVVYGIVKKHGGSIDVESTPGVGTQFMLYFQEHHQVADGLDVAKAEVPVKGAGGILIVDDEPLALDINAETLRTLGYHVFIAGDGYKAIEVYELNRNAIQLVLLDMAMPGMDGADTFRTLRRINPNARVLIVSGYADERRLREVLTEGAIGLVRKPFNAAVLSRKISEILSVSSPS